MVGGDLRRLGESLGHQSILERWYEDDSINSNRFHMMIRMERTTLLKFVFVYRNHREKNSKFDKPHWSQSSYLYRAQKKEFKNGADPSFPPKINSCQQVSLLKIHKFFWSRLETFEFRMTYSHTFYSLGVIHKSRQPFSSIFGLPLPPCRTASVFSWPTMDVLL